MSALLSIVVAFSMYSRIPMPRAEWTETSMRYAMCAFPLVGVVQGLVCLVWGVVVGTFGIPREIAAAGFVVLPILVNGGIHLDGLADTHDALASHAPREKKLAIMKDSASGAFAVIAVGCHLLILYALFANYPLGISALVCLPLAYGLSRALSAIAVVSWPSARPEGMAGTFSKNADARRSLAVLVAFAVALAGGLVAAHGIVGACVALAGLAMFGVYRAVAMRVFGGVTGDVAGWFVQYSEMAMIAVVVIGGLV